MSEPAHTPWRTPPAVLAILMVGTAAVLAAYAAAWLPGGAPTWASWLMVLGVALVMPGTLLLGALRPERHARRLVTVAVAMGVLLLVAFGAALWLPDAGSTEVLFLGLPRRAAIVIYGAGILPILWLPLAFARDFRDHGLDAARLAALREECARVAPNRAVEP